MIRADPALDTLFYQQSHIRTITHRVSGAVLKIVAAAEAIRKLKCATS